MTEDITKRSLDDIRTAYKKYLNGQKLSKNTITTSSTDAFYIWRKRGCGFILGKLFYLTALKPLPESNSSIFYVNIPTEIQNLNVNGYMAHLRKFRRFLHSEFGLDIPEVASRVSTTQKNLSIKAEQILQIPTVDQVEYYLARWGCA